jgi:type I restriction enzyme S subunit
MSWKSVKIPEVLFFQEGPGVRNTQFTNSGVKLLNVGNINLGDLNLDATKIYISKEEANGKYKHFLVEEGDLLIASSGIVVDNFHNKITWAKKEH